MFLSTPECLKVRNNEKLNHRGVKIELEANSNTLTMHTSTYTHEHTQAHVHVHTHRHTHAYIVDNLVYSIISPRLQHLA